MRKRRVVRCRGGEPSARCGIKIPGIAALICRIFRFLTVRCPKTIVVVVYVQPAPVAEFVAPAPVIHATPAPVVEYVALELAVIYAAPAPVVEYVSLMTAPAPVVTQLVATVPVSSATVLPSTYCALPTAHGAFPFRWVETRCHFVISTDGAMSVVFFTTCCVSLSGGTRVMECSQFFQRVIMTRTSGVFSIITRTPRMTISTRVPVPQKIDRFQFLSGARPSVPRFEVPPWPHSPLVSVLSLVSRLQIAKLGLSATLLLVVEDLVLFTTLTKQSACRESLVRKSTIPSSCASVRSNQ